MAALWQPSLLWTPPSWLTTADPLRCGLAAQSAAASIPGKSDTETSSSSSNHADDQSSDNGADADAEKAAEPRAGGAHNYKQSQRSPQQVDGASVHFNGATNTSDSSSSSSSSSSGTDSDSGSDSSDAPRAAVQQPWASANVFADLDRAFAVSSDFQSRRRAMHLLQRGTDRPAAAKTAVALEAEYIPPAAGDNPVHIRARVRSAGAALTSTDSRLKSVT